MIGSIRVYFKVSPRKKRQMHDPTHHHHDHDHDHGHTHEQLEHPGRFAERGKVLSTRDFGKRAFTVGVGGPVGTGKTALVLSLCRALRDTGTGS